MQCTILEQISSVAEGVVSCKNEDSCPILANPNTEKTFTFAHNTLPMSKK